MKDKVYSKPADAEDLLCGLLAVLSQIVIKLPNGKFDLRRTKAKLIANEVEYCISHLQMPINVSEK